MVSMPSCTVPMFWKRVVSDHMIQSTMPLSRVTSAAAAAMVPTVTAPSDQSQPP